MSQHLADRFDLMRQMLYPVQTLQAEQFIKPAQQTQTGMLLVQPEVTPIGGRAPRKKRLRMKRNRNAPGS